MDTENARPDDDREPESRVDASDAEPMEGEPTDGEPEDADLGADDESEDEESEDDGLGDGDRDVDQLEPDDEYGDDEADEDDDQVSALAGGYDAGPEPDLEGLVHYVVSRLVADPESIEIHSEQRGGTTYLALRVPESDLGRVIGRGGRTAQALRTLVSIAGSKSNVHARLDIDG